MCLILFSYETHPDYRLILASNRDEFYKRKTEPLGFRDQAGKIVAGRDCEGGGTWLGATESGRFAALTNYRDPSNVKKNAPSRGFLVSRFLKGNETPEEYLHAIREKKEAYNGFNLIAGDPESLFYYSNRADKIEKLSPGIYGLSNAFLDTPWPKVTRGKKYFEAVISQNNLPNPKQLFKMLSNSEVPPDSELPDTGMGLAWERILGPLFIQSDHYGTRSSAVVFMDKKGHISFSERTYEKVSADTFETRTRRVDLMVPPAASRGVCRRPNF